MTHTHHAGCPCATLEGKVISDMHLNSRDTNCPAEEKIPSKIKTGEIYNFREKRSTPHLEKSGVYLVIKGSEIIVAKIDIIEVDYERINGRTDISHQKGKYKVKKVYSPPYKKLNYHNSH